MDDEIYEFTCLEANLPKTCETDANCTVYGKDYCCGTYQTVNAYTNNAEITYPNQCFSSKYNATSIMVNGESSYYMCNAISSSAIIRSTVSALVFGFSLVAAFNY